MIKLIECPKCHDKVADNLWNDHVCTQHSTILDTTSVDRDAIVADSKKPIVADTSIVPDTIVADSTALVKARKRYNEKKPRKSICLTQEDWDELDRLSALNKTTRSALISTLLQEESNIKC